MSKPVLITGATGKQGGSVITALLEQNADVEILAVTRDSNSTGAQKLKSKSPKIQLVEGNLDDPEGLFKNAQEITSQPIWGVYSVQVELSIKDKRCAQANACGMYRSRSRAHRTRKPKNGKAKDLSMHR